MRPSRAGGVPSSLALLLVPILAPAARAQAPDVVGLRAQGMGGAFVAVADDATAVYWNPAALAKGALLSAVVEGLDRRDDPSRRPAGPAATRRSELFVGVGVPSLGLAYYRTRLIRAPAGLADGSSRNVGRAGAVGPSSLTVHTLGASVLQSLGERLVVGATLKWERGVAAAASEAPGATPGSGWTAPRRSRAGPPPGSTPTWGCWPSPGPFGWGSWRGTSGSRRFRRQTGRQSISSGGSGRAWPFSRRPG